MKPTSSTLNRRRLLQGLGALPAAVAAAQPPQRRGAQGRGAASTERFVGIQMGPHSMLDEGIDRVLDRLQGECGINSVMVYSHTYYTADGIRRKRTASVLAQDHGVPARDLNTRNLPYVWVKHHDEYFQHTILRHQPVNSRMEYAGNDLFAEMLEPIRKRRMKLYARILEPFSIEMAGLLPNWVKVLTVDVYGRAGRLPCFNNPDYRNFWLATSEDMFRSYELDGFQFGAERSGPLSNLLLGGTVPYCFCEYCRARGREKGIDVERAREGMKRLHAFVRDDLLGSDTVPVEGVPTLVMNHFFRYPEILAWERLWRESKEGFFATMYSSVKAIRPEADTGEHVDHPGTTFDPFYRAVMTYGEMADYMDFIKPILYHDIAGPRTRIMYLSRVRRTFLKELSDEQALDLFYTLKGYDEKVEPKLADLDKQGLGPDYVFRETRRCVQAVAGRAKIYAGVGIDIPGNGATFSSDPEGVYEATRKAFEAGAAGVLISREYDEMRLPNLRAVGRAIASLPAKNG
ncbi:MAG TPA: hypothetical protein VMH81_30825 [Bryobacteraceae bacterium]|nr:hypothetical protein [Bryobacteraceae bacterium]